MSARAIAMFVEDVGRADALPAPVLRGLSNHTSGEWSSRRVAGGLVAFGGVDVAVSGQWLVVGKPSTDARGLPGFDAAPDDVGLLLENFGSDTEAMTSGPWLAINVTSSEVVRPLNHIVPWTRAESFGFRAWCTEADAFGGFAVTHDADPQVGPVVADPVPGFSLDRLHAEIDLLVDTATKCPETVVWKNTTLDDDGCIDSRSRLWRTWRAEAQRAWRRSNARGVALFAPQLERVVQDQFSFATIPRVSERAA